MAQYAVRESPPLRGEIPISTSKNAVLPIMCGALLTGEDVRIERVPELTDVKTLCALLASCGCSVKKEGDALVLNAGALQNPQDEEDVRKMRASVLVLGPLLSRLGEARIPLPGGCAIGQRPIDQHLKGMSALGAKVKFDHGGVTLSGRLRGAVIYLDMPSVGATENLLMAATLASGTTRIENAAKEPEIVDLAAFLNAMGARICGAGTSTIVIEGVRALHAVSWQPISDRIEAGTMACACAITGGELLLSGVTTVLDMYYFEEVVAKVMDEMGIRGIAGETVMEEDSCDSKNADEAIRRGIALIEAYKDHPRVSGAITPHGTTTCSPETLKRAYEEDVKAGTVFTLHVAEMDYEMTQLREQYNMTPIEFMEHIGVLGPNTLAAHSIRTTEHDVEILAKHGASVAHCIASNTKAAKGVAPVLLMHKHGMSVGFGTDGPASAARKRADAGRVHTGQP